MPGVLLRMRGLAGDQQADGRDEAPEVQDSLPTKLSAFSCQLSDRSFYDL
jgi:hypothetical protein